MTATKQRKGGRGKTPLEQAAELVHVTNAPELPPLVDLDTMPDDLIHNRELSHARASAYSFQSFLICLCARNGIPLDNVLLSIELLVLWVECELAARIAEPECYVLERPTEEHAYADHLTVTTAPTKRKRYSPTLPGCQGHIIDGAKCDKLRSFGARFCPTCEKRYLAMVRQ